MRQVVLDTETTGLEPQLGHRVIEIGAVEMVDRKLTGRHFHKYVNPEREVDDGAFEVHGLSRAFLSDKPLFAEIVEELVSFLRGADVIIHNAGFDVSFLDYEFSLLKSPPAPMAQQCQITDSLAMARHKHPGQKNNLDALCRRYQVDNSARTLHGALLDAEILADVYLAITGGQTALFAGAQNGEGEGEQESEFLAPWSDDRPPLKVIVPSAEELAAHEALLDVLDTASGASLWRQSFG
ncbi:MAG: DNA polymerase III subunit epsilon [Gammaproteobacteria bacterium]|nr:DNA polymerase III subunit epsilon [Gammaproteobacteria bacterium]